MMKRKQWMATALLLCALLLTACGSGAVNDSAASGGAFNESQTYAMMDMEMESPRAPMEMKEKGTWDSVGGSANAMGGETETLRTAKLIYTANISLQTLEFETAADNIAMLVANSDGYFETKEISGMSSDYRNGYYTIRVPSAKFESFCDQVGELCHVTSISTSAKDVSEVYYDTESRLTTAKTKLARLQELLARAESMEDIITIESAISDTEWTIENLSGTLRGYDALVDYATIHLNLREVYRLSGTEEAPKGFFSRIASAFSDGLRNLVGSVENFAVWFVYNIFGIAIAAAALFFLIRFLRRRPLLARKKKTPPVIVEDTAAAAEEKEKE